MKNTTELLITEYQANGYFNTLFDNVEKLKSRPDVQMTSMDVPLYIDHLCRLRPLFQKILTTINIDEQGKGKYKLTRIFDKFPPPSLPFERYVFKSWYNINSAEHYWEMQVKVDQKLVDLTETELKNLKKELAVLNTIDTYRSSLRSLAEFISEYSSVQIADKLKKFYYEKGDIIKPEQIKPQPKIEPEIQLTDREKILGSKAATMLPILFVLDVSNSMAADNRIEELNKGTRWFYKAMKTDEITRDSVELGLITFGHEVVQKIKFEDIDSQAATFGSLDLKADGTTTNIGGAMNLAIEVLVALKAEYTDHGLDFHQPWVVLITDADGKGIDDYEIAAQKICKFINQDRLILFPIAVGTGDLGILHEFSPKKRPLLLREKKFGEFFDWLKENAQFISKSRPDEKVPLKDPSGWAYL